MTEASINARLSVNEARTIAADTVIQSLKGAPQPISDMTNHLAAAQGKGVRTLLLLYAAMGDDGLVPSDATKAAAAIELFHLATLVHDDVIDDSPLRRGQPTVQHKFGRKQAVICGDYLLCLAASLVAPLQGEYEESTDFFTEFVSAISSTCLGELMQFRNNRNVELDIAGYLRIIMGKTSALFYASALSGALLARCNSKDALRLARFGRYLGVVFQIADDCKDYEFSESEAQKTVGKDILEGVVTLPLIYALESSPQLRSMAREAFDDAALAGKLVKAVRDAGGTQKSRSLAARYAAKAEALLKDLPHEKSRLLLELLSKSMGIASVF